MSEKANSLWRDMFGIVWDTLLEADPNVGAFLLLHDTKEAMIDESAMKIMGFGTEPSYYELKNTLSMVQEYSSGRSPILLKYIDTNDQDITAGIIHLDLSRTELVSENYLLYTQAQVVRAIDNCKEPAFVMLLCLDFFDSEPGLQHCYITSALDALNASLPDNAMVAGHSKKEYWIFIPDFKGDPLMEAKRLQNSVESCKLTDRIGSLISERHSMTFSAGICCGDTSAMYLMHSASFAMYEAAAKGKGDLELFNREQYNSQKSQYNDLSRFTRLVDNNLFVYHFQPIVSAQTGEIEAYEALMRTDPTIGFNPLQVLELANRYDRLYDIELLTMDNALNALSKNQSFFENRRLFINSIPSKMLTTEDYFKLKAKYGELWEKTVIEFTEQTEANGEGFELIRNRLSKEKIRLAIDDYGTGYSNTSNLVRYAPDYVKIDRELIENIDRNVKMQALVKSLIDFIHSNGWSVIAEGVETAEEVRTSIELGADLLQGYWVSRPKPVFINEVSESVRSEIVDINLKALGMMRKTYRAKDGEELDIVKLALEKYTDISLGQGKIKLTGDKSTPIRLPITIMENYECELTLHNTLLVPDLLIPAITVGSRSSLTLICEGENEIRQGAILVPESAKFILNGSGALTISPEAQDCYAIGCGKDKPAGDIFIETAGVLNIAVNGENCIGIGGGTRAKVHVHGGDIHITCTSGTCVGAGTISGDADVSIHDCGFEANASSATAVCIGSLSGSATVDIHNAEVNITGSGNSICAVGSLGSGTTADIKLESLQLSTNLKGKNIVNLGTNGAETNCSIKSAKVMLYSEGGSVCGIGDKNGGGNVTIANTELLITFLSGNAFALGSPDGTLELIEVERNFKLNE